MDSQVKLPPPPPPPIAGENQSSSNDAGIVISNNTSRPVSFYDNIRENGHGRNNRTVDGDDEYELQEFDVQERSPTQVPLMSTTVPQNIGGVDFAGRHEPTRNSLRHSRMIVMTRNGNVPKKYLPPIIRFHKLAKALLGLQLLLGFALAIFSLWLLLWTPNIKTRDNPYWSGIPLLLSGILGLILVCCCRKEYPGMPKGYLVFSIKVLSVCLSTVAGTACLIACTFTIIHLISLSSMSCAPFNSVNATCFCQVLSSNDTALPVKSYHYVDLSCMEVDNILGVLIIFSCGTNAAGAITALWYVYLHWSSRYGYTYSKVKREESRPVVISNNSS